MGEISSSSIRQVLSFEDNLTAAELYGDREAHLRLLQQELGIEAHARGNEVRLSGTRESVDVAKSVLEQLYDVLRSGRTVRSRDVRAAIEMVSEKPDVDLKSVYENVLSHVGSRRVIRAKNLSQRRYVDLIQGNDITLSVGPAGTGKTYLAMAMAIAALNRKEVARVILTRPAVEAGEKLGFLPGDLAEKVNPYMRPLYDALHDMMDFDRAARLSERDVIEVAPLAFMRGRTLNDSFVILDEAQNTTTEQMKMFLTRLGYGSKAVITGDLTQVDLPSGTSSGLSDAVDILSSVKGIGLMRFSRADVVRHPLVQSIIEAYEKRDGGGRPEQSGRSPAPSS
ncbi:MAG: phosphate starvation-inducible protein PhoH [Spirochaeta sp.]|nr:phosphate starvation-inducible protein PhoH [Spirochaeta sp.]RPG06661.1 MAG: PhoH family protein [Proteobacteria bacterium TMED72]